jgi:hypothetical protein
MSYFSLNYFLLLWQDGVYCSCNVVVVDWDYLISYIVGCVVDFLGLHGIELKPHFVVFLAH